MQEIHLRIVRPCAEQIRFQDIDAGVRRVGRRLRPARLVHQPRHPAVLPHVHEGVLPGIADTGHDQGGGRPRRLVEGQGARQVDVGQDIPPDDQHRLLAVREGEQRLAGVPGRPAVPVRLLIGQRHTAVLFPEPFLHPGRQVAGADPGAADTVPFEEIERIRHQRPPAQADHGFGHVAGQGAQGFLLPFRQNDRRHQLTHIPKHPFVMRKRNAPHKSNSSAVRRRTASSFPRYP